MADRDLQVVLSSGELTGVNIGGTTTGDKVLKKSELDAGYQDLAGASAITKTKYDPQATPPVPVEGQMYYDENSNEMRIQGPFTGVEVAVGHNMHMHAINNSGGTIEKGMAVRQSGVTVGGIVQIVKAQADTFDNARIIGIASAEMLNGEEGALTIFGEIPDTDTSAYATGVPLYLSATIPGAFTAVAPDIITRIGGALTSAVSGRLFVYIINNKNIPIVFGGMQGQSGTGVYSVTTTAQDIIGYDTENTVVVVTDIVNGLITIPNDGKYRLHFTSAITFPTATSTRTVYIELYDATGATVHFAYAKNIPRDATEDSLSFSWPIEELTGNIHKIRIRSSVAITVTFTEISFDIQSVSIT